MRKKERERVSEKEDQETVSEKEDPETGKRVRGERSTTPNRETEMLLGRMCPIASCVPTPPIAHSSLSLVTSNSSLPLLHSCNNVLYIRAANEESQKE